MNQFSKRAFAMASIGLLTIWVGLAPGRALAQGSEGEDTPVAEDSVDSSEAPDAESGEAAEAEDEGAADGSDTDTHAAVENPTSDCGLDDCRENFQAGLFLGSAIDSFAAEELNLYLNPEASGDTSSFERFVGGVEFGYRLFGDPEIGGRQVWVYGWTRHGVRSVDVNCAELGDVGVCDPFTVSEDPTEEFLFLLRNATSLEAALGFRWELFQLQAGRLSSSRFYVGGEYGFLTVSGDDDDVLDMTKIGVGMMATSGKYQGSYLEVGTGTSDVFERDSSGRIKVEGRIKWDFASIANGKVSGIVQMNVDATGDPGADSIQSYVGLSYTFSGLRAAEAEAADAVAAGDGT